jgi:gluconate 5-dehydrogenase
VVVHGRDPDRAKAAAEQLAETTGGQTLVATFDITDQAAVDHGIGRIQREWGVPDILVNNAGIQRRTPFIDFNLADWNDLMATNRAA